MNFNHEAANFPVQSNQGTSDHADNTAGLRQQVEICDPLKGVTIWELEKPSNIFQSLLGQPLLICSHTVALSVTHSVNWKLS